MTQYLRTAIEAALEAGSEIMEVYSGDIEIDIKGDESPLTQADTRANTKINAHLLPLGIPIISEENRQLPYSERSQWDRCWIVDPLDGTKEFIKRNGEFTVNIALVENGTPTIGVIYVPVERTLYFNDKNERAYKVTLEEHKWDDTESALLQALAPGREEGVVRVVGSRSHLNAETEEYVRSLEARGQNVEIVSKGSSLKFCLVAEGKADIYPRFAPTMEWDTAAGQSICRAVGVAVRHTDSMQPLTYNKENLLNPHFLVHAHD